MERVGINTSQNVAIDFRLASIGDRIVASLLDYLFFIAYFVLIIFVSSINNWNDDNTSFWIIAMLPVLFYDLLLESLMNGQSFGKYIMKIRIMKLDGSSPSFGSYLLRWMFRIIDTIGFTGAIALITILINGKGQRIGDIAAGTTVIKLGKKITLNDTILKKSDSDYKILFKEVQYLSDKDIDIIKYALSYGLKHQKYDVINKASDKTRESLKITTDLKPMPFLETIIKDYNHFQFLE